MTGDTRYTNILARRRPRIALCSGRKSFTSFSAVSRAFGRETLQHYMQGRSEPSVPTCAIRLLYGQNLRIAMPDNQSLAIQVIDAVQMFALPPINRHLAG